MTRLRLAAIAALVLTAACTEEMIEPTTTPTVAVASKTPSPTPSLASRGTLLYVDGRMLIGYDLDAQTSEVVTDLPSADAALAPDGKLLTVVRENDPKGPGPEGFRDPVLMLTGTTAPEPLVQLGPGRSPLWSASGAHIAAIAPTPQGEKIVVYNIPGAPLDTAAPTDELWSLVGWQGEDIIAIGSVSGVVRIPATGDEIRGLRVAPAALWGVGPSGDAYVRVEGRGGTIVSDDGRVEIDAGGGLGDGAWSWDGTAIVTTLITESGATRLALIDAATGDVTSLAAGRGAQGNVVWSLDNDSFAFVRVKPDQRTRLEAVLCELDGPCEPAFSWDQGVTLLGFL